MNLDAYIFMYQQSYNFDDLKIFKISEIHARKAELNISQSL